MFLISCENNRPNESSPGRFVPLSSLRLQEAVLREENKNSSQFDAEEVLSGVRALIECRAALSRGDRAFREDVSYFFIAYIVSRRSWRSF